MSEEENNFKNEEDTPHFHIDGVAGYMNNNKAKIYLFRTDADPKLRKDGELDFENLKHNVQAVLEMSPLTAKRVTAWMERLVEGFEERNREEWEKVTGPEKMFG